jgi:Glycosyl hydrolases family 38 N-terminal domain
MALTKLLLLTLAALLGTSNAGTRLRDASDFMKLFKGPTADYFLRGSEAKGELRAYVDRLRAKYGDRQINAHIIAHTHDDVGWLKTVDEYFTGANDENAHASVQYVLDTVIDELLADPSKKFTYVEMKFLSMWWKYQTDEMKAKVRQLVQSGRLDIVNAGWSMHDEACTHYEDMINNMY